MYSLITCIIDDISDTFCTIPVDVIVRLSRRAVEADEKNVNNLAGRK